MSRDDDRLKQAIEDVVRDRFRGADLQAVEVRDDVDSDGEGILRVRIVIDLAQAESDASAMSGFVRHLRPKLAALGETRFPVMSFISRADAERFSAEPA